MVVEPDFLVLRKRADFLAAAQSGKKWVAPSLILQLNKAPQGNPGALVLRYGLTASSKIGNAVIRNRARRRLRALATLILKAKAAKGYDYVLIARAGIEKREHADLVRDLTTALKKLGVWQE